MLNDSPLLQQLLLEDPWPLAVALGLLGLAILFVGRRGGSRRTPVVGMAILLAGAAVVTTAVLVETDREQLLRRTHELIAATAPFQEAAVAAALDPNIAVGGPDLNGDAWRLGRDVVVTGLSLASSRYPLRENTIKEIEADITAPGHGRSHFVVLSVAGNGRARTRWLLTWRRDEAGHWVVTRVNWLEERHPIGVSPNPALLPAMPTN